MTLDKSLLEPFPDLSKIPKFEGWRPGPAPATTDEWKGKTDDQLMTEPRAIFQLQQASLEMMRRLKDTLSAEERAIKGLTRVLVWLTALLVVLTALIFVLTGVLVVRHG
jgi:hypothetical protein